ncbi:putative tellurium resistance membrane protein TerC [Microbacterium trichothecenolyticum]|uniref:TerC family protein n=1 Tax=Microbacterium trichothecenolyticum TaxID=69370 RepID=UPI00285504DC|nr:TerC family protein [Microbacterium trichothecenolyticum]MDR7184290.1 putative tellurium resistance membrane protein TerC [Microbacterium trichothecenolyticum]
MDFSFAFTPDLIAVFLTLFVLEVVLGVDNVIFISILASKLPKEQQAKARNLGLTLAMLMRVVLVLFAGWIITLKEEVFFIGEMGFSWKDIILIAGGLFLVYKAVTEIHHKLEGSEEEHGGGGGRKAVTFGSVIAQILVLDLVFSLDSVITAVGMTTNLVIIITVVVLSFGIMLFASRFIFAFVNKHPTVKMLALSFLLLIGVFLIAEGFGFHIDKAFIYGPMAFAIFVEALNLWAAAAKAKREQRRRTPVQLRPQYPDVDESVAVAAALSKDPGSGSVGLSSKPVAGDAVPGAAEERQGLG